MSATVAIGMFDGVHLGHRFLLGQLRRIAAERRTEAAVVTFDRHPLAVVAPERCPRLLTTVDERVRLIRAAGIERVEVVPFDDSVRRLTAAQFCTDILGPLLDPRCVLLGYDHGFGADRLKGGDAYAAALAPARIDVVQCPPYPERQVSSSLIRKALQDGDIGEAAEMLGRPYSVNGPVEHGRRLGRTIGFPTANVGVKSGIVVPANGVYSARVTDGPAEVVGHRALVNIGTAPTVNGDSAQRRTVEAHILDASADLYGQSVTLAFDRRLRAERRFASLEELRAAIAADVAAVREKGG